jgi:hypothetical protein
MITLPWKTRGAPEMVCGVSGGTVWTLQIGLPLLASSAINRPS